MASQGFGSISREEKEEYVRKKMEDMKKKSEEILRRHAEVEADKRNADMLSDMVSTKVQGNLHSQSTNVVKNVKNTSHIQREKSSERLVLEKKTSAHHPTEKQRNNRQVMEDTHPTERMRSSRQISEENVHPAERVRSTRQMPEENFPPRRKENDRRKQKFNEQDDGPPPDPINYLSDPYRDGSVPEVDRSQDSRRHRSNYGGENFRNVKPTMQQRRNYERQHPPPPSSNSHISMSVQMTGKERKEYENWKAERNKIDEERIARQKTSMGTWKREWDLNKTEQEEAAKRNNDKQFYKQPRWITESGDNQDQNEKKNQGNRGRFNPSFEHRYHEKSDRSVMVNEHNTLTVVKSAEREDEPALDSQHQRNQGGRKIFERKQNSSVNEERNLHVKKDTNWKQTDKRESITSKGDGWEDVETDGVKWDNDVSARKDIHPLQQANTADKEWKTGGRFGQRRSDNSHESRAFSDNRYQKSNQNVNFPDKGYVKRQKSLNSEDSYEGNAKQDKQFSGDKSFDGRRGGRHYNEGRKHEAEWKDDGNWNKARNDRHRKISDGWEESWNKTKEFPQRRTSDSDDPFDNLSHDHKPKFASERFRGGSFKGNNNRVYSSNERGKHYSENWKYENTSQRTFSSSENRQFREKEYVPETESQNNDRRWEGFDHKKGSGRSRFWEGNRRGNDQRKASKNYGNRGGNGRNSFETNKNAVRQEYHTKNPSFTNLETGKIPKPSVGNKNKHQVSKDGWECEPSDLQTPSVKWIEGNEKEISKEKWKPENIVVSAKTVENISSQDSSEHEHLQKTSTPGDAESHDDSWEDVSSGGESELSDSNDGIHEKSNDFTPSKLPEPLFDEALTKGDNVKCGIINDLSYDTSSEIYPMKNIITDDVIEQKLMETANYFHVSSEMPFVASHNESIEKILEEVYNDTIMGEMNNMNVSDGDEINSVEDSIKCENSKHEDSLISSSLDNTFSDIVDEALQSSSDVCCKDTNYNSKEDNLGDGDTYTPETTVLSLDCSYNEFTSENSLNRSDLNNLEDINSISSVCETTAIPTPDSSNFASESKRSEGAVEQDAVVSSLPSECASDSDDRSLRSKSEIVETKDDKVDTENGSELSNASITSDVDCVDKCMTVSTDELTEAKEGSGPSNPSIISDVKSSEADICNFEEHVPGEENKSSMNVEEIQMQESELSCITEHCDNQETSVVMQENHINEVHSLPSENTMNNDSISLESSNKLNKTISIDCSPANEGVECATTCNNVDKVSCIQVKTEHFSDVNLFEQTNAQINQNSDEQQLPVLAPDGENTHDSSMESKMGVAETELLPSKLTSDPDVPSSESTNNLKNAKEGEHENVEISTPVTLDSDSVVSVSQLSHDTMTPDRNTPDSQVQEAAVTSCKVQQIVEPVLVQKDRSDQKLSEVAPDGSSVDSVNATVFKTGEVAETPLISSEFTLDSDITREKIYESGVTVTSASNNTQMSPDTSSINSSTLNLQKDAQKIVVGNEESTMNSDKAKEQNSQRNFSLDLDNGTENASQNNLPDTSDPVGRTVRKADATESTTEFTEVLEVTSSIPQRIAKQDSDSSLIVCKDKLCLNTKDDEKISSSHNLDTRLPKDLIGE